MNTSICLISDLHGYLPPTTPESDVLVVAGDICPTYNHDLPFQSGWLINKFAPWCKQQPAPKVIVIPGNHDWIMEKETSRLYHVESAYTLLIDQLYEYRGIKFYGSPWTKRFNDWAFNMDENQLARKYEQIPSDPFDPIDVLIAHGPPHGYGDTVNTHPWEHLGSASLYNYLRYSGIKLLVCGHIHTGHGIYSCCSTVVANASLLDEQYRPVYSPIMADFIDNTLMDVRQL